MPLTEKQKKILLATTGLVAGGGIVAFLILKALAKRAQVTPVPPPEPTPPPPLPPPPAIPSLIQIESCPTVVVQDLGFQRISNGWSTACLGYAVIFEKKNAEIVFGYKAYHAYFQVVDAAGKPVPNVPILVWSTETSDDQGGKLLINGYQRSATNPHRVISDENGRVYLWFAYAESDPETLQILEKKHDIGCGLVTWGTIVGELDYPGCCGLTWVPFPAPTQPTWVRSKYAETEPRLYTAHLEVEGAPRIFREVLLSCKFKSECLW